MARAQALIYPHRLQPRAHRRSSVGGFTLVEVIVAAIMLTSMAFGLLSTMILASQMARVNGNSIAAKNIAQGYFERMALDDFANIGPAQYPDIPTTANPPVWLDQAANIRCKVQFRFKGYGLFDATTNNKTIMNCAAAQWTPDEFAGDSVYIVSGPAIGQFATIAANTATQLTLTNPGFSTPPTGSRFMINNGKTVEITTIWTYRGRDYSQTVRSLIINAKSSAKLGF